MHQVKAHRGHSLTRRFGVSWRTTLACIFYISRNLAAVGWIALFSPDVPICQLLCPKNSFSSSCCQLSFLCWRYSYECLWNMTSLSLFLSAGIKSLMFQNQMSLNTAKMELLVVMGFLNLLRNISLIFLTFDDLCFKQIFSGYLWLRIVSRGFVCRRNCLLSLKSC